MCKMHQEPGDKMQQNSSKLGLLAVLVIVVCAAVLAAHWPALSTQALSFDDGQYLTENVLVQKPSWASARQFLSEVLKPSTVRGYYQPLAMISLMVDYALGGRSDNLTPFHRTSLALHVANTALIIVLLYLLFGRPWIAAAVGLLFGVHPMTVESIPWVGERKTLLAAFFALWCLILYVRFSRKNTWQLYLGCIAMYVLALLSKPTSTPLPVLMLLLDFWPLNRLNKTAVLEKIPLLIIGAVSSIITYISQSRTTLTILPGEHSPAYVPLVLCHNIIFYLCKIIWPAKLSSHYSYPVPLGLSHPMVLAGVIGTCILILLLVISLRWTRGPLTGWLFFFLAILPTMQIIGFSDVIASDKFAYLPSVGLLMILASFLGWLYSGSIIRKLSLRQVAVIIIVVIIAGAESLATRRYLACWRDTVTLSRYMLTLTPDVASIHNMLGVALKSQGRIDEAIHHLHKAVELNPYYAEPHYNLGNALKSQGKLDQAIACYQQALQIRSDFAEAHYNLANVLSSQGKPDDAISHYQQALKINPNSIESHNNLANILASQGKLDQAISHFRQALKIEPDCLASLNNLAWVLATHPDPKMRDGAQAIALAEHAAKLTKYRNPAALQILAAAYAAAGQFNLAIKTAQTAETLASSAGNSDLANQIRSQLNFYRQSKPLP